MNHRISTITATASVVVVSPSSTKTLIDLNDLFARLECSGDLVAVKHKDDDKKIPSSTQNTEKTARKPRKSTKVKKSFDNQLTLVFRRHAKGTTDVKIFCNGRVQLTGVKSVDDGPALLDDICVRCGFAGHADYRIRMMNTDWKLGHALRLYDVHLRARELGIKSRYEPSLYPGVLVKLPADDEGDVKKSKMLTIMVFRTGSVVVAGATALGHLDRAVEFCDTHLFRGFHPRTPTMG